MVLEIYVEIRAAHEHAPTRTKARKSAAANQPTMQSRAQGRVVLIVVSAPLFSCQTTVRGGKIGIQRRDMLVHTRRLLASPAHARQRELERQTRKGAPLRVCRSLVTACELALWSAQFRRSDSCAAA